MVCSQAVRKQVRLVVLVIAAAMAIWWWQGRSKTDTETETVTETVTDTVTVTDTDTVTVTDTDTDTDTVTDTDTDTDTVTDTDTDTDRDTVTVTVTVTDAATATDAATGLAPAAAAGRPRVLVHLEGTPLALGDRVLAQWRKNDEWYPGSIVAAHPNGTFDIHYSNGDRDFRMPAARLRKRPPLEPILPERPAPPRQTPCVGPGVMRRCDGACVNVADDDAHCGGCGNRCAAGKTCDGAMFCRDADGNL